MIQIYYICNVHACAIWVTFRIILNNPFDYIPDRECDEAFRCLTDRLETMRYSENEEDIDLLGELSAGKMLGVLIASDGEGRCHTLYAFSGQLGQRGFHHPLFVGPVFDYLEPDGYFKTHEAEITRQNEEISRFRQEVLAKIEEEYLSLTATKEMQISEFREKCRISKEARDARRRSGLADERELEDMIRRSQYEKAELHRLKKRLHKEIEPCARLLEEARRQIAAMQEKRHQDSEALQGWLFSNFRLLNAEGKSRSLREIFADTPMEIPPSGAGECCAPKLLQAAYRRGWHPEAIAEYWYGAPKRGELRRHGESYPACRGKCLPVLRWMLQGLHIEPPLDCGAAMPQALGPKVIFENEWMCVVEKSSGLLSVPGKGAHPSVQRWLEERYGAERRVRVAHRLDQDTSGLLIATFGDKAYKAVQGLFARREVVKTYVADLEGNYESLGKPRSGEVVLPLSPDWLDRPRQRVDMKEGKPAVTEYEFAGVSEGKSRVIFKPHTGRTHQLRVHAASAEGLDMPIVGDRLYGISGGRSAERLHLHAGKIEFVSPIDGKHYSFESATPF